MDLIHTLLVEDTARRKRSMRSKLASAKREAFTFDHRATIESAAACVRDRPIDVVLLDPDLPDATGIDAVMSMHAAAPHVPIVVGVDDEGMALQSLRAHADDYVLRPNASRAVLELAIRRAFTRRLARKVLGDAGASTSPLEDQLAQLVATHADGLVVISARGCVLYANRAAAEVMRRPSTASQQPLFVFPSNPAACFEVALENGQFIEVHAREGTWDDEQVWIASMFDVTKHKLALTELKQRSVDVRRQNDRLMKLASVDPLTGTLNRRGLSHELAVELRLRSRTGAPLSAILIDCDDFKQINESLGCVVGDAVLMGIAQLLRDGLRPSDHIGRIGGDEFLVLLSDTRFAEAYQVADRLRASLAEGTMSSSRGPVAVTASVGVELLNEHTKTIEQILEQTETALQASKHRGKNRISTSQHGVSQIRSVCGASIETLCARASYRVLSKPIVRLADRAQVARNLVPQGAPGPLEQRRDFLRGARERNVLSRVDELCLRACLDHAFEHPGPTPFHLQVSPSTLLDRGPEWLSNLLWGENTDARFCIEISEREIVGDAGQLRPHVQCLRGAGARVAIVDAGSGRGALETLMLLKPDLVALDAAFVHHACQAGHESRSLRHTVEVMTSLGCDVIADGIGSESDIELMRTSGVSFGRGPFWDSFE